MLSLSDDGDYSWNSGAFEGTLHIQHAGENVIEYFECLGCRAVTVVSVTPPKCSKCGSGWGMVRSNMRAVVEKIIGAAAPNEKRASPVLAMERRKN
jgi:hypothetical protein